MDEYIVLDTETTGLDASNETLVEVAAVRYSHGHTFESFTTLIHPQRHIPETSSAIHHLTDAMVANAPTWDQVREPLCNFIGNLPIIAHNAPFDRSFLPELHGHRWICNFRFARKMWPDLPKHGNQALRYLLNVQVDVTSTHRALDDARVTAATFAHSLAEYTRREQNVTWGSLQRYVDGAIAIKAMPFGKHRGVALDELPDGYLQWAALNLKDDADINTSLQLELQRRSAPLSA